MGSLIYESRDASGLYYRRNRYYDSEKGRFTQEDPIGLAGGVNAYGFAEGDPVSYSDPYGLSAACNPRLLDFRNCPATILAGLMDAAASAMGVLSLAGKTALSALPWVGDGNDAVTAVSGRDVVMGENVGTGGRLFAGAGAVLPFVSSSALRNIVGDLYKGTRGPIVIGTGSTADAIRHETATGIQVGGRWHLMKGQQYLTALNRWIGNNPNASARDLLVARSIRDDLQGAVDEAIRAGRTR